jgi:hypothetical protein
VCVWGGVGVVRLRCPTAAAAATRERCQCCCQPLTIRANVERRHGAPSEGGPAGGSAGPTGAPAAVC